MYDKAIVYVHILLQLLVCKTLHLKTLTDHITQQPDTFLLQRYNYAHFNHKHVNHNDLHVLQNLYWYTCMSFSIINMYLGSNGTCIYKSLKVLINSCLFLHWLIQKMLLLNNKCT